ncbi:MAG: PEGA domain-containing protein [Deltaproteobacteria bacterium]|nr:PEGA domain-containing protein [Deltaproteobacteria bacterium]
MTKRESPTSSDPEPTPRRGGPGGVFEEPSRRTDRVAIGILGALVVGLGLAFAFRAIPSGTKARTPAEKKYEELVIRNEVRPEMVGFKSDPRSVIQMAPRVRKPGTTSRRLRPLGHRGVRVVDVRGGEPRGESGRGRARRERPAWTPRPRTPVPAHAKYGEDLAPQRATPLVRVLSEPSGQPVEIDGVRFGATPVSRPVPRDASSVNVRILGPGYREVQERLSPDANGDFVLFSVLQPET